MAAFMLKPVCSLAAHSKNFIRTIAANSAVAASQIQSRPFNEIPGPTSLPLIGQIHHFLPGGQLDEVAESPVKLVSKLYNKYGPIVKLDGFFGGVDMVFLIDPESASQVLRTENWLPTRAGFESLTYYRKNRATKEASYGLLTDHGDVWKQFRSTVNPVMLQPKTVKLYSGMLDDVALDMVKRLRTIQKENRLQNNLDMEMNLWALESISLVALGRRLNCLSGGLPENSPEKRLITVVHEIFETINELDFKPSLWRYYATKTFKKAMKMYEEQESLARYFINKAMEEMTNETKKKSDDEKGVLEKLLEINKDIAIVMATELLFAGVDTTSNTMIATLYFLGKNQDKQDKLREEVLSQQEKRPYLKACLKEALRMMPVVSGNTRTLTKDMDILGYNIPKGKMVVFMHHFMSLMEEQYPKPNEYLPERWIVPKDDPLYHGNAHPFANMPFGFGVRSCIGRRLAELELETFLGRLIENFKIEWTGGPPKVVSKSINYTVGPYNITLKDIK